MWLWLAEGEEKLWSLWFQFDSPFCIVLVSSDFQRDGLGNHHGNEISGHDYTGLSTLSDRRWENPSYVWVVTLNASWAQCQYKKNKSGLILCSTTLSSLNVDGGCNETHIYGCGCHTSSVRMDWIPWSWKAIPTLPPWSNFFSYEAIIQAWMYFRNHQVHTYQKWLTLQSSRSDSTWISRDDYHQY